MATNSTIVKFVEISRASFDALSTKDGNTLYVVKESNGNRKFYQGQYNLTGVDANTLQTSLNGKQNTLVSGSNIKTVNGNSLLGSGNITLSGGGKFNPTLVFNEPNFNGNRTLLTNGVENFLIMLIDEDGYVEYNQILIRGNKLRHRDVIVDFSIEFYISSDGLTLYMDNLQNYPFLKLKVYSIS